MTRRAEQGKLFPDGATRLVRGVRFRERLCKSALSLSGISDYSLNCYMGCEHDCAYCYASYMKRFAGRSEPWGRFVDVKVNIVSVLERELRRRRPGKVFVSSVCDPYQPAEAKCLLTGRALEALAASDFSVSILTKSVLARRDLPLLERMGPRASLGMSITTMDGRLAGLLEGRSSPPVDRLRVLAEARDRRIKTHVMCAPLIPLLTGTPSSVRRLFRSIARAGVDTVMVDGFNPYPGARRRVLADLRRHDAGLARRLGALLAQPDALAEANDELRELVDETAREAGLSDRFTAII